MLACALAVLLGSSLDLDATDREIAELQKNMPGTEGFKWAGGVMATGSVMAIAGGVMMGFGFEVPGFCYSHCGGPTKPAGLFASGTVLLALGAAGVAAATLWMVVAGMLRSGERGRRLERLDHVRWLAGRLSDEELQVRRLELIDRQRPGVGPPATLLTIGSLMFVSGSFVAVLANTHPWVVLLSAGLPMLLGAGLCAAGLGELFDRQRENADLDAEAEQVMTRELNLSPVEELSRLPPAPVFVGYAWRF